jgi:hypothetical protein
VIKISSLLLIGSIIACGPSSRNGTGDDDDGNGHTDANNNNNGGDGAICASSKVKAEMTPLDIMVMLDQSSSMTDTVSGGGDKWDAVTGAIKAFVQQTGLNNMSMGIQYFGLPSGSAATCTATTCMVDTDCGATACGPCFGAGTGVPGFCLGALSSGGDSCTAADYSTADVEIAALPGVGSHIISSMAAHSPTTSTPTSAALQGAEDHAKSWAMSHAGDAVVVVLATDGDPTECDQTLADINAIAATALTGTPKILTFVIGVGSSLSSLNGIAAAGGTTSAFLVDTGGNVNAQFLAAMNAIQHTALGCQYTIPMPTTGSADYTQVNVNYTPGSGGPEQTIPNVPNQAACPASGDAWYYDNNNNPTQIILCNSTCTRVEADTSGEVDIALGCSTIIL